jgi:hypothetical protein
MRLKHLMLKTVKKRSSMLERQSNLTPNTLMLGESFLMPVFQDLDCNQA